MDSAAQGSSQSSEVESRQKTTQTPSSMSFNSSAIDIRNSNLHATAPEFQSATTSRNVSKMSNQGAIQRTFSNKNKRNTREKTSENRSQIEENLQPKQQNREKHYNRATNSNNGTKSVHREFYNNSSAYKNNFKPEKNYNYRDNFNRHRERNNWAAKEQRKTQDTHENWRRRDKTHENSIETPKNDAKREGKNSEANEMMRKLDLDLKPISKFKKKLNAASQRERLEQMVMHRMLECPVCCEKVRNVDKIWSCKQCYQIFHLDCIMKWAKSSHLEEGWRCPACQNVLISIPREYLCYCDKFSEPHYEPGIMPHSCGEVCQRKGRKCEHTCKLLCHPGPCPDCVVMMHKKCGCGRTSRMLKCNSTLEIVCDQVCGKVLNCGVHQCDRKCHWDECGVCAAKIQQECFCFQEGRQVDCRVETQNVSEYSCGNVCGKLLMCGAHKCGTICHEGDCGTCDTDPQVVKTCPCGKMELSLERRECSDPIPCCDETCNKLLKCGQPSNPHVCKQNCHAGDCAPCSLTTMVRCRCGHMDQELECAKLTSKADDARCKKKCSKKRLCMKHKCNQFCCIEVEHICPLPCNHMLSCGLHRCESTCHAGRCQPCWRTSFEELYCECGANVIYPPVPCGTRPPECRNPCPRPRPCGHEPLHNCHMGPCPQCTIFTTKLCHGGHESRGTIPCHQEDFSCGLRCNLEMQCGQHLCTQQCHKGPCPSPCNQPCPIPRANCEHACNKSCHPPPCPTTLCKEVVTVSCECGLRTSTKICMDLVLDYHKIAMTQIAIKMSELQRDQSVDMVDVNEMINKQRKRGVHKILECNDECKLVERNRRLAIGLQIRNPDLSSKLTPRYSEYMKQWAKKDAKFCDNVHAKLTELVELAKQSKQKSRSLSFDCMNREKRHFVHEYCEHFGCSSAAYDREPNRNIVATAYKEKSWLPSCSLTELLQRENGQRKVPGPVMSKPQTSRATPNESVSLRLPQAQTSRFVRPSTPEVEFIDYFDNPPL